ncbi:hypothetical protein B0G66_104235 [Bacillus badius]|nr:hypothetical protein B0G66_104235 [Bacillus badius]
MIRDLHQKDWAKTAIARETGDKIVLLLMISLLTMLF